jgi:L-asparagine transporter-like permease
LKGDNPLWQLHQVAVRKAVRQQGESASLITRRDRLAARQVNTISTGAIALLVYFIIALSQLLLRARLVREGTLKVRMWAHPWLSTLTLFLILAAFVVMVRAPDHRQEVAATLGASVVLALFGVFSQRRRVQRA